MASTLQSMLEDQLLNNYLSIVAATALAYDYVITLPREITFGSVGSAFRLRIPSDGYKEKTLDPNVHSVCRGTDTSNCEGFPSHLGSSFQVRYVGLPVALVSSFCNSIYLFAVWGYIIFLCVSDLVMVLRMYAMYNQSKMVLVIVLVLYIPAVVALLICTGIYYKPNAVVGDGTFGVCAVSLTSAPQITLYLNVTRIFLNITLCILAVARFIRHCLEMRKTLGQWRTNQYMKLLATESLLFFVVNFVSNVMSLSLAVSTPGTTLILLVALSNFLPFTLPPRLIINMREFHMRRVMKSMSGAILLRQQRRTIYEDSVIDVSA
ncbi:hypothetical protein BU15DRAFT_80794 [Melanogaster broomeanus]|nr:hypothetical protein BU15DRAFT_80794 [Melanogaster broomeanus]